MQHLTEEQLVAFHYRDLDSPQQAASHLASCADCTREYDAIRQVLTLVSELPVPDRGDTYGSEVWTRLRWRLGAESRRRRWQSILAVAAMLAVAFFAGLLWRGQQNAAPATSAAAPAAEISAADVEALSRLLEVAVNDHLNISGRMLMEVANATSDRQLVSEPRRAEGLVTANRIYRQTAQQRGDERIVQLLNDLEPILLELANAGDALEGKKLSDLQKRIESKELLFKVRVMSAPTASVETPLPDQSGTDSL